MPGCTIQLQEPNPDDKSTMNDSVVALLRYWLLSAATTMVNKYVLSVMMFTYPTIFQGWQTLAGVITLRVLMLRGYVERRALDTTWAVIAAWLPGMMLFVGSIYSGSVALSKLSIPVYLCMQNVTAMVFALHEVVQKRKIISVGRYLMLMLLLSAALFIALDDPEYRADGYHWVCIHLVMSGCYVFYEKYYTQHFSFGETDRLYYNYIYSVIVLVPSSYFLGDLSSAKSFPFWDWYRFYVGCFLSGIFGVFRAIFLAKLKTSTALLTAEQTSAINKILTATVSVFFFHITLTATHSFWILVNLIAGILCTEAVTQVTNMAVTSEDAHARSLGIDVL